LNQLHPAAVEERVETNENGIRSLIPKCCEGRTDLPAGSGVEDLNLHPDGARCCSRFSRRSVGICRVCRVDQHSHTSGCGHQLPREFQPFRRKLSGKEIDSGQVSVRSGEASDQTELYRIVGYNEDDGDRGRCSLRSQRRSETSRRDDHSNLSTNQIDRQLR